MRNGVPGLLCAIAFFMGTCGGLSLSAQADEIVDLALLAALVVQAGAWCLRRHAGTAFTLVLLSVALLGLVSAGGRVTRRSIYAPVGFIDAEPSLVRFEARLLERCRSPDAEAPDRLDRFRPGGDRPPWRATAEIVAWHGEHGRQLGEGRVTISMPEGPHDLAEGDLVQGIGWLSGASGPENPGEHDARAGAWRRGHIGRIRMDAAPVRVAPASRWTTLRSWMREWVDRSLVTSLEPWRDDASCALVVAMTTGRRLPGYDGLRRAFADTGLAHFLAISGFNVAVLFVTCGVIMELARVPGAWRGWLLMSLASIFLLVVDLEVSVVRAGVAGLLAGASIALGRGWRSDGLLAMAAIGTLTVDPAAAWNVGFQLSYLAVLALRHGSAPIERRLARVTAPIVERLPNPVAATMRASITALAASVAASLAATPVTLAWFGTLNPWCAPASTLLGPVAATLTVLATLAAVIGQVPGVGLVIGAPVAALAWIFRNAVAWVGTWPGCSLATDAMPWWWAAITLTTTFGCWIVRGPISARACGLGACVAWSMVPLSTLGATPSAISGVPQSLRWTMLSVGDGSAHLLECGGSRVLFDAGSLSRARTGSTCIVPALRELGVDRLDAIVVSHPHLDHFGAVPEIVAAFEVGRVLLTPAWFDRSPEGSAASELLHCLAERGIVAERVQEGDLVRQGPVTWRCLHPPPTFRPSSVNDGSAAFALVHDAMPDRPIALLLGDVQEQAIARLLGMPEIVGAWAMELPHHGSWRPIVQALCERARPSVVMQSTGARRFRRDRHDDHLVGVLRGVTCRDGAVRLTLDPAQAVPTLEHWTPRGWQVLRPR